jgi:hypothetical protein
VHVRRALFFLAEGQGVRVKYTDGEGSLEEYLQFLAGRNPASRSILAHLQAAYILTEVGRRAGEITKGGEIFVKVDHPHPDNLTPAQERIYASHHLAWGRSEKEARRRRAELRRKIREYLEKEYKLWLPQTARMTPGQLLRELRPRRIRGART